MAIRSEETIYQEYYTALAAETALGDLVPQADDAQTLLTDVTTAGKVADHRLWLRVFSFFSWMLEVLFDSHQTEVTTKGSSDKTELLNKP